MKDHNVSKSVPLRLMQSRPYLSEGRTLVGAISYYMDTTLGTGQYLSAGRTLVMVVSYYTDTTLGRGPAYSSYRTNVAFLQCPLVQGQYHFHTTQPRSINFMFAFIGDVKF